MSRSLPRLFCGDALVLLLAVIIGVLLTGDGAWADDHHSSSSSSSSSPCDPTTTTTTTDTNTTINQLDSAECLRALRTLMADEDRFWFGSNYSLTCFPPASFTNIACINGDPKHLSIVTRMRESNDSSVDVIRQVLNVTFQVPAGTYQACGNTYNVEAFTHTIDPTKTTPIPLWSADHMPSVTWKSESDKLYTLIVWDAGALFLHALMYNINGSSPDHGKTAWNYRGPKNPRDRDQPYAFLLYEQGSEKEETFVRDILIAIQSQSLNLSPVSLATALSLTGPIGASVLTVRTDPYAIGYMKKNRITNYCPDLLTPKFSALPLSYDVSGVRLMSSVDVTFMSPEISVSSCSRDVRFVSNTRIPNPMADGRISPVYTRLQPHVTLVPTNFFDNFYFLRLDLTLLLLDVTEELSGTHGTSLSLLHWQVVNIREGDVMSGETTQPYKRPLPLAMGAGGGSNSGQRVFMFLLLRQSARLENVSDLVRFTGRESCPPRMRDRCQFNLTSFVTEHRMTIEGASWFMTSPDAYSRQQAIQQGLQGEAEACRGVVPQPTCTGGSEVTRASSLVVVLGLVSALQLLICPVREA